MTNERLFNILEYLIDHAECYFENLPSQNDEVKGHQDYILELRKEIFSGTGENNGLNFKVESV